MLTDADQLFSSSVSSPPRPYIGGPPGRPPGSPSTSFNTSMRNLTASPDGQSTRPTGSLAAPVDLRAPAVRSREGVSPSQALDYENPVPSFSARQLIVPPPRRESIGLGFPSSQPVIQASPSSSRRSSRDSAVSPIASRRSRPSLGIDTEFGMNGGGCEEGMEVLAVTPSSATKLAPFGELANGSPIRLSRPPSGSFARGSPRPLPPIPQSAPFVEGGPPIIRSRKGSLTSVTVPIVSGRRTPVDKEPYQSTSHLVSETTARGTISQRRQSQNRDSPMEAISEFTSRTIIEGIPRSLPFPDAPLRSASSAYSPPPPTAVFELRIRAQSQPEHKSSRQSSQSEEVPLSPSIRKTSFPELNQGLRISVENGNLAPPVSSQSTTSTSRSLPNLPGNAAASDSLISPLPEAQPSDPIHRPFHLLRILYASMDPESSGSYLTSAIHISSAVWKPSNWAKTASKPLAPPKITAQDVKVRCIEALLLHFEIIRQSGSRLLNGPREGRYGQRLDLGSGASAKRTFAIAEEFCGVLDELDEEMDQGYKALVKGGVALGGWKGKKTGVSVYSSHAHQG